MTDAELIEEAKHLSARLADAEIYQEGDVDDAADTLRTLADRLAELTKPTPWRSVDEPPVDMSDVFVRVRHCDGAEVVKIGYYDTINRVWPRNVTGWQPIVRPEP